MQKTKIFTYLLVLLFTSHSIVNAQWTRLTPSYTSSLRVADVVTKDSVIIAVGYSLSNFQGHIFRSFNNGVNWDTVQLPPVGYLFETVAFKDHDTTFIGGFGANTIIIRSVDKGHNWSYFIEDTATRGIADMVFFDSLRGYAGGYNTTQFSSGNCYYTSDGGYSWYPTQVDPHSCLDSLGLDYIDFLDVQTGYAVSNFVPNKYLLKTTDSGKHWNIIHTQDGIGGVYFWNVNNGVMVAQGGQIFKTSNGGMNWTPKPSPVTVPLFSVSFIDQNTGFAVGANGVVIKSINGGETWTTETSPATQPLFRVKCFNNRCYATGDGGTVLRSGVMAGVKELPLSYRLNVYPNPTSSVLNISSPSNHSYKMLTADLLDMNGKIVISARTEKQLIKLDVANLPNGIYTAVIDADGERYSQEIMVRH